jgi:dolichol-phosphate mannosyltransferase
LALILIIIKLINPDIFVSWITTLIILVFLIGGIQLVILWIIWEYIGRIYKENKGRPLYIIKKFYK